MKRNLNSKFIHPNARILTRGRQLTCMLVDRISEMEDMRVLRNVEYLYSNDND